jgi:hypothetical protein
MAAATLADVTLELEIANENLGIMRANSTLAIEYMDMFHDMVQNKFDVLVAAVTGDALAKLEATREQNMFNEKILAALEDQQCPEKPEKKEDEAGWGSITGIGLAIAAALGTVVGGIKGWYKGWKMFMGKSITGMEKFGRNLNARMYKINKNLGRIGKMVRGWYGNLKAVLKGIPVFLKAFVIELGKALKSLGKDFSKLFKGSKFGQYIIKGVKAFKGFMTRAGKFFRPLVDAFKTLRAGFGKSGKMISTVTGYFAKFSKAFKFFGTLASKIAWPITVIIATVQGAIAAWNKEGGFFNKIGAFFGGLVGSLVGGLMDLGKSLISWVLGVLGFDNAEKWLDSFSFEELIGDLIEGIFDLISDTIDWFKETFTWENMKKQWGNFTDWVGEMKDSLFGWWDEFKAWMLETFSWKNIYMNLPQSVRGGLKYLGLAPDLSEDGDASESNMNDAANTGVEQKQVPQGTWQTVKGWFNSDDAQTVPNQAGARLDAAQDANANMKKSGGAVIINAPQTTNNVNNSSSTGSVNVRSGGAKKAPPGPSYEDMMTSP